jgi:phosphopantothenoylcysteine decarboxylase/phosphopantothenate--cysteine ligase
MEGRMASGLSGVGRMAEPEQIFGQVRYTLSRLGPLTGRRIVVSAGGTREPIDPVRYISNHSSGKQGYALAEAAVALGAETVLVSGPVSLPIPPGAGMIPVESARDMLEAVEAELPCDIAIFAAAVADWRVAEAAAGKIKKEEGAAPPSLAMIENPDILRTIGHLKTKRPALVVGFAAETGNVVDLARAKLAKKGCDLMVANDVSPGTSTFGGDDNKVWIVAPEGTEIWPPMSKREVAQKLMAKLADKLAGTHQ